MGTSCILAPFIRACTRLVRCLSPRLVAGSDAPCNYRSVPGYICEWDCQQYTGADGFTPSCKPHSLPQYLLASGLYSSTSARNVVADRRQHERADGQGQRPAEHVLPGWPAVLPRKHADLLRDALRQSAAGLRRRLPGEQSAISALQTSSLSIAFFRRLSAALPVLSSSTLTYPGEFAGCQDNFAFSQLSEVIAPVLQVCKESAAPGMEAEVGGDTIDHFSIGHLLECTNLAGESARLTRIRKTSSG